jgi:glycosyltransferase involved in cell wall biosynthesis
MKICFFTKHEITWGSSRERVGLYLEGLKDNGHRIEVISVIPDRLSRIWIGGSGGGRFFNRAYSFLYSRLIKNLKFLFLIIRADAFDLIFIQKVNLSPLLLWLLRRRNHRIIFDFDDLCFAGVSANSLGSAGALKLYRHIIAGNKNLAELAARARAKENVTIIPTAIDCRAYYFKDSFQRGRPPLIGWAGSGENHLENLRLLVEPLKELSQKHEFSFKLIGAMGSVRIKGLFAFLGQRLIVIDWLDIAELPAAIRTFDIGLMPLEDSEHARNKCGFKALQYMASGVPAVVSPVGLNTEIITDGANGFLAAGAAEWVKKISRLLTEPGLGISLAKEARRYVEAHYARERCAGLLYSLIAAAGEWK